MNQGFSLLANFPGTTRYILSYLTRGCLKVHGNDWMNNIVGGTNYVSCGAPRFLNHNVAIALMSDKQTLVGPPAPTQIGAAEGDHQVHWITYGKDEDHQNVHTAALDANLAVLTWERIVNPHCQPLPMGCTGTFAGTVFQFIDSNGKLFGKPVTRQDVTVAGDIATLSTDKVCFPYIDHVWDVLKTVDESTPYTVDAISFACISANGTSSPVSSGTSTPSGPAKQASSKDPSGSFPENPGSQEPNNLTSESSDPIAGTSTPSPTTHKKHKTHKHKHKKVGHSRTSPEDYTIDSTSDDNVPQPATKSAIDSKGDTEPQPETKSTTDATASDSHANHVNHINHVNHVNHINHEASQHGTSGIDPVSASNSGTSEEEECEEE